MQSLTEDVRGLNLTAVKLKIVKASMLLYLA